MMVGADQVQPAPAYGRRGAGVDPRIASVRIEYVDETRDTPLRHVGRRVRPRPPVPRLDRLRSHSRAGLHPPERVRFARRPGGSGLLPAARSRIRGSRRGTTGDHAPGRRTGAGGRDAGRHRAGVGRRPDPRVVRARLRRRRHQPQHVALERQDRDQDCLSAPSGRRRRGLAQRPGLLRGRRRSDAGAEDRPDRRRRPAVLSPRPPERVASLHALDRKRAADVLPPPSHPANEQHVHRRRHERPGVAPERHHEGLLRRRDGAAGRWTRRAATSISPSGWAT